MHQKTILNTWKEIAQYVGRSVRTIQRWERDLGFPIHRPRGKQRSAVLAMPLEIDEWARRTPSAEVFENAGNLTAIDRDQWKRERLSKSEEVTHTAAESERPADEAQHHNSKLRVAR